MADKVSLNMNFVLLLFILLVHNSYCSPINDKDEKPCCCYDLCEKNFTTNSVKDVQKIAACQRGCRFYTLVLHVSHELSPTMDYAHAKEGCLISCSESYTNPSEVSSCNFGCSSIKSVKMLCDVSEYQLPQISYSILIEESDVLIHPGESDSDDVLIDPGLRKQFEKTLEVLLDEKPKLPEIHFRNLPIANQKPQPERSHVNFKCPKFYGFDPKLEFRNGKIIIGDLYLFVGVFVFVVICFLIGHHIETKNMTKQLMENRLIKTGKDDFAESKPLLNVDVVDEEDEEEEESVEKENLKDEIEGNEILECNPNSTENIDSKFESITLVFHDDDNNFKSNQNRNINIEM